MSFREETQDAINAAKRMLSRRARFAHAYRSVWESPDGRIVINDLLHKAGLLTDAQAPCDTDTRSYQAGMRAFGVHILQRLRWSEAELVHLARQQTAEQLEQEAA